MLPKSWISVVAALVTLAGFAGADDAPKSSAPSEPKDMKALVNGKDLTGWEGNPKLWSFKDGAIHGETTKENPTKGNTFLIWKGGKLKDFDLRLSFRIKNGNSGVQYRSKQVPTNNPANMWVVSGYQAEVTNNPGSAGFLYHERGRGSLCRVGTKVVIGEDGKPKVIGKLSEQDAYNAAFKKDGWNDYIIIAKGNHLVHYLNGIQTVDVIDNDPKRGARSGILALQIHAGPPMVVEFKDVRLKQFELAK